MSELSICACLIYNINEVHPMSKGSTSVSIYEIMKGYISLNWNVRLAYIQTIAQSVSFGIIQTAFSIFITQGLGHSEFTLGNLFTVSGVASTLFVFPSGWFADKYRRDILIRISVLFGVLGQAILIYSTLIIAPATNTIDYLFISQICGGLGFGLSGPASQALLADSIEPGHRSKTFANMHFINLLAAALGPFLAAGLTILIGDSWELNILQILIVSGAIFSVFAYGAIFFVSDKYSLENGHLPNSEQKSKTKEQIDHEILISSNNKSYDIFVPVILVVSGVIIGFGAGATVAFFPVLFADPEIGYNLSPLLTYSIVGIGSVFTGLAGLGAQRLSRRIGRVLSMFIVQLLAIICLLGIVTNLYLFQNNLIDISLSVMILAVFYISRNALMNASGPISRSLIMDIVPTSSRAKWNSLETLAWGMFWSVSASIGGWVVVEFGFTYVFLFTATLYTIATFLLLAIRNRAPSEAKDL
ncbi:MAG: MFS transporter [Candidatus Hodarchaeales archaeon]